MSFLVAYSASFLSQAGGFTRRTVPIRADLRNGFECREGRSHGMTIPHRSDGGERGVRCSSPDLCAMYYAMV